MQNNDWNLDTANNIKTIKLLIHQEEKQTPLVDYLNRISDLAFSIHASEMRYGETHYFRGVGKNIKATIVPTLTLKALPRKYRSKDWLYITIYCHPNDQRFDEFTDYETIPASQYKI